MLFSIHEVVSHLGNTHLVLEGPMVALHRQLPKAHPIYVLLEPHVEGTAIINWGAQDVSNVLTLRRVFELFPCHRWYHDGWYVT